MKPNPLLRSLLIAFALAGTSPRLLADDAQTAAALRARGVLANSRGTKIRFVTHAQVDEVSVAAAVAAMKQAV